MHHLRFARLAACALLLVSFDAFAGGPWVTETGHSTLIFGFSRKTGGSNWDTWGNVVQPADSTLVNGLFHDFQYAYFNPTFGVAKNLEISATFLYLWGYERILKDPKSGKAITPEWEYNAGFTDFWLNAKYQILHGEYPLAVQISSRFPDLYKQEGPYTRYVNRIVGKDTAVVASSEWRGLLKRDFGVYVMSGRSFGSKGYVEGQLGYNLRQDAFADQWYFEADGGYNIPVLASGVLTVKAMFDYTGGVGNGKVPDSTDRFYFKVNSAPQSNYYFNNSRVGRVYGSLIFVPEANSPYSVEVGIGRWLFGSGAVRYTEMYAQVGYAF